MATVPSGAPDPDIYRMTVAVFIRDGGGAARAASGAGEGARAGRGGAHVSEASTLPREAAR